MHIGHIELFQEAKKLGDKLVVILNNDNWLKSKKGHIFMPENERADIIRALRVVDEVVLTDHPENPEDMSVSATLLKVKPDVFAQGGDRKGNSKEEKAEAEICEKVGCEVAFNLGSKIQSSSWLLGGYLEKHK